MATIAVKPIFLRDVVLTIAANDYQAHVSTVEFAPSGNIVTWQGLTPESVFSFAVPATWTCNLSYAQDWETPDSLSRYLFEHEGETVVARFEPTAGGPAFTADIILVPGTIGGAVSAVGTASVTLGVEGRPELLPAAGA